MGRVRITLLAVALLLVLGACGGGVKKVQGLVVDVQSSSITDLDSVTVRDDSGRLWAFKAGSSVSFSPSHLREHQAFAWPVIVFYEETPEGLLAYNITD
ncbi:MAG: hypothetical protein J4F46_08105 [Dehalococcoidia bacterium]|nr:hypothetical protein [Dehalococcoidia bacterium]